jgi:hypothetical protein
MYTHFLNLRPLLLYGNEDEKPNRIMDLRIG